jgi:prophage antirepressor-like protein
MNNLMIFEEREVEVFEFEGKILFNPKHVAECLGIADVGSVIRNFNEKQVIKLTNSKVHSMHFRKLHNTGENFLTESGVYKLIFKSRKESAERFQDWVTDEVIPMIRNKGRFDLIEQQLMTIEDEVERNLNLAIYKLEQVTQLDPEDRLSMLLLKDKKQELLNYKTKKELDKIKNDIEEVKVITEGIKKATVLREGDINASNFAKHFGIYSTKNNPHNNFAKEITKELGIYKSPEGNAGYQDEYVSINLTTVGGRTIPTIFYSEKCVKVVEEFIRDMGGL